MKCPSCGFPESKVIDSRPTIEGNSIRRRRECLNCGRRFTTYETIETTPILVVKNDGSRQSFDASKLKNGIIKACEKRPVHIADLEKIADDIEHELQSSLEREVPSEKIGIMVMERLKALDEVAYIRFASVHREFRDLHTFMQALEEMTKSKEEQLAY